MIAPKTVAEPQLSNGPSTAKPLFQPGHWVASISGPGVLLSVAGMVCLSAGLIYGSPAQHFFSIVWLSKLFGFALGMLLIRLGWLEAWSKPGWQVSEILSLISIGLLLAGFSYWCGMRQFGGFDQSIIADVGWRLYSGQIPYVDFPCTLPIGFYLGAELACRMFGVFWSSFVKINVLYFLLSYFWLYFLLRGVFYNRFLAMALVITCLSMPLIVNSYLWYNPITSVAVMLYVASVAAVLLRPYSTALWVSIGMSLFLTALMKPSISGVAMFGGTLALSLDARTRWINLSVCVVAAVLCLGVLEIHGTGIGPVVEAYLSVSGRIASSRQFLANLEPVEIFFAWAGACALLPGFLGAVWPRKANRRIGTHIVVAGSALIAALLGFRTNGEPKVTDLSVGILAMAILLGGVPPMADTLRLSRGWVAYLVLICSLFTCSSVVEGAIRYRVRSIGLGQFFEYETEAAPVRNDFFKGVTAGRNLHVTVDAISSLIASQGSRNIYFGPRLQWAYAAFHIQSPKGLPVWWDQGVSYPPAEEAKYISRLYDAHFDPIVLMDAPYMDTSWLSMVLRDYVAQQIYPMDPDAAPLVILVRKEQ